MEKEIKEKKNREMCYTCNRLMWCKPYKNIVLCGDCMKEARLDEGEVIEAS